MMNIKLLLYAPRHMKCVKIGRGTKHAEDLGVDVPL